MPPSSSRRSAILLLTASAIISLFLITRWSSPDSPRQTSVNVIGAKDGLVTHDRVGGTGTEGLGISHELLSGDVIMPKLGNETAKAELGRAAWKLFHTTFARFPEKPTADQKATLRAWTHLFQRMYPCGECAGHFRTIIDKYPPQVSSRNAAAAWGCHVHNEVNKSLQKPLFNCADIGDFYDCGCADDDEEGEGDGKEDKQDKSRGSKGSTHAGGEVVHEKQSTRATEDSGGGGAGAARVMQGPKAMAASRQKLPDDDDDDHHDVKNSRPAALGVPAPEDGRKSTSSSSSSSSPLSYGQKVRGQNAEMSPDQIERLTGSRGREFNDDLLL